LRVERTFDAMKTVTIPFIQKMTDEKTRIAMVTAYDSTFAKIVDEAGVDMILVGDSLGMVVQGHENTIPVTLEDVIYHTACVSRAARRPLVIADLPFMSYQVSRAQAVLAAGRAMKEGGARAVKLEGGLEMVDTVRAIVDTGIPVMAHLGLKPQSVHRLGGYKIQGKDEKGASLIVEEARAMEQAGAFSIVLEGVAIETAAEVTEQVRLPTIGIASGPYCSGQVLVIYDLLGMNPDFNPKFLKKYMDGSSMITDAVEKYIKEVRSGEFPTEEHGHHKDN
jgi:3-methyl-2-oxobutanoate hydroxymethyltransferase